MDRDRDNLEARRLLGLALVELVRQDSDERAVVVVAELERQIEEIDQRLAALDNEPEQTRKAETEGVVVQMKPLSLASMLPNIGGYDGRG